MYAARLGRAFRATQSRICRGLDWKGAKNGELLHLAANLFDVLITTDVNLYSQQEVERYDLAVLVLRGYRNSYEGLLLAVPLALAVIEGLKPATLEFVYVDEGLK